MKTKLLLLLLFIAASISNAQKSSPVAGHAAELIDLLRKDYSVLDPQNRNEQLNIDRGRAVAIFKTYLIKNADVDDISGEKNAIELAKEVIRQISREIKELDSSRSDYESIKDNKNKKIVAKNKEIATKEYEIHNKELKKIKEIFSNGNAYLEHVIEDFMEKYKNIEDDKTDGMAKINYQSNVQKSISFLSGGGFNINAIVEGLADFLADRIKAEITNYAMENIKEKLNPDNLKDESLLHELMALLPETTKYIKQFNGDEILKFTDNFRAHISLDIKNLVDNIGNLKTTPRFIKLINKYPDIEFAFEAVTLIPQLASVDHPVDFFEKLETSKLVRTWSFSKNKQKFNIANTIKMASLLTNSLLIINSDDSRRFASTQFMANYAAEPNFFMLFVGFLHQQNVKYYNVAFDKGYNLKYTLSFDQLMNNTLQPNDIKRTKENVQIITSALVNITDNAEKLYQEIEKIKRLSNDDEEKVDIETIHGFLNSFIGFFEDTLDASQTILETSEKTRLLYNTDLKVSTDIGNFKKNTTPYLATAKSVNNIVLQLHNKEYGLAIEEALTIPERYTDQFIFSDVVLNIPNQLKATEVFHLLKATIKDSITEDNEIKALKKIYEKIIEILKTDDDLSDLQNDISNLIEITDLSAYQTSYSNLKTQLNNDETKKKLAKAFVKFQLDNLQNYIILHFLKKEGNIGEVEKVLESIKGEEADFSEKVGSLAAKIKKNTILKENEKKYISILNCLDLIKNDIEDLQSKIETYSTKALEFYMFNEDKEGLETSRKELLTIFGKKIFKQLITNTDIAQNKEVTNIINFTSSIAKAENSEAVKQALESYALPTGSYSIKRKSAFNVSIDSYPGILAGYDINNLNDGWATGITAPVGLSLTPIILKNLSLFIPIIDIGAPVRLRLYDSNEEGKTLEKLPELSFKNIFTPGAYLSYGFGDSPFALNAGVQYGPELALEGENITINDKASWSINVGFVVDIPLFTIYNRPR